MKRVFSKIKEKLSGRESLKKLITSLTFIIILVVGFGIFLFSVQNYAAEVCHSRGLSYLGRRDYDNAIAEMEKATKLNPKMDVYWRDLSQVYVFKLVDFIQNSKSLSSEQARNEVFNLSANSVNSAKRATDINPSNVANWNVRGYIYQNMIGVLGGADDWAIKSYKKALEIENTNPYIYTQLGRSYLGKADLARSNKNSDEEKKAIEEAQKYFQKALELKSDYAPALYQLAMISLREGKTQEAISKLHQAETIAPFDVGIAFQLGLLYYNTNDLDKAQAQFERAVQISPNYSNARYYLGLIYDKKGEKDNAIKQFKEIEKYNPDNELVKKILVNLEAGKSALEGISNPPGVPVVENKPQEIKE